VDIHQSPETDVLVLATPVQECSVYDDDDDGDFLCIFTNYLTEVSVLMQHNYTGRTDN